MFVLWCSGSFFGVRDEEVRENGMRAPSGRPLPKPGARQARSYLGSGSKITPHLSEGKLKIRRWPLLPCASVPRAVR